MEYENYIILIPALDPDVKMINLIQELNEIGFNKIMITDDGSKKENQYIFKKAEDMGAFVTHHSKTLGKGEALRTALQTSEDIFKKAYFYIMADCDGEHTAKDIRKVAIELKKHPDHFVLGIRKFEKVEGKKVSFWVNYFQRAFFRVTNSGKECPDPRSGLRGFPQSLKTLALSAEGSSYDYDINFLDDVYQCIPTSTVSISAETYTIKPSSHFRPVVDLLGMYMKFWRYLLTSNISTVADITLFAIFNYFFTNLGMFSIFFATVCARIISGLIGYVLNRYISFRSHLNPGKEMIRYFIVFITQMAASGISVSIISMLPISPVIIKIIIDFILFFYGYNLQKNWVFADKSLSK